MACMAIGVLVYESIYTRQNKLRANKVSLRLFNIDIRNSYQNVSGTTIIRSLDEEKKWNFWKQCFAPKWKYFRISEISLSNTYICFFNTYIYDKQYPETMFALSLAITDNKHGVTLQNVEVVL